MQRHKHAADLEEIMSSLYNDNTQKKTKLAIKQEQFSLTAGVYTAVYTAYDPKSYIINMWNQKVCKL